LLKNSLLTESTAHNERNRFDWISLLQAVLSTYVALNAFGLGFAALLGIALIPVEMVSDYLQPGLLFFGVIVNRDGLPPHPISANWLLSTVLPAHTRLAAF